MSSKSRGHIVMIDNPNDDIAIRVERVSKSFKLPHDKQTSIKGGLINIIKNGKRTYEKQEVLKDVSFEIKKGEFFGIVGRNGSGKSTLLKMLAGIYTPTEGNIIVNGSLTPFIELGVGFNPELTGRENVFLNGALLGFNRNEMTDMYNDIVEFAELGRFMDQKLKNYSSGMQVRLAFSIAIRARSDILLLDEVLAVGDANFQQKCFDYFAELKDSKRTVIFVSHDRNAVNQYCDRCLLLESGATVEIGEPKNVLRKYEEMLLQNNTATVGVSEVGYKEQKKRSEKFAEVTNIEVRPPSNQQYFTENENIYIKIAYQAKKDIKSPIMGFIIKNRFNESVVVINTRSRELVVENLSAGDGYVLEYSFTNILGGGSYSIVASIVSSDGGLVYNEKTKRSAFRVESTTDIDAVVHIPDKAILRKGV